MPEEVRRQESERLHAELNWGQLNREQYLRATIVNKKQTQIFVEDI